MEFTLYRNGVGHPTEGNIPVEEEVILTVNGQDLVALMCTPSLLEELALGFLYNERLIEGMEEVVSARVCGTGRCVDVWLYKDVEAPRLRTLTSGCAGGTTFDRLQVPPPAPTGALTVTPAQVVHLAQRLQKATLTPGRARGVHTSAVAVGEELRFVAEDVGRHNSVDKLAGLCLRHNYPMQDLILLTTGRVSSEMLVKAARMNAPVVISLSTPTSLSVELARLWNIALIGYARGRSFHVYAGGHRIAE